MYYNIDEVLEIAEMIELDENGHFSPSEVDNVWSNIFDSRIFASDFSVDCGATKLVIIPSNANYVIKIPFDGEYHENWDDKGNMWFDEFTVIQDYCYRETLLYESAKKEHVEKFFLPIEEVKEASNIAGWPIYVQPKATIYGNLVRSEKETLTTKESIKYVSSKDCCINISLPNFWLAACFDSSSSVEEFDKFIQFLNNDSSIKQDLHQSNIGYYNNKAVIIDYAGYFE